MIITEISGNLANLPGGGSERTIDWVEFDNETRLKRVQRARANSGAEVALRFSGDFTELKDGDVLYDDGEKLFVAKIKPTDVLVITPESVQEALRVAHTLGNRHLQAQFFGADSQFGAEVMVVRYDHTVEHHLDHVGVAYERTEHVMPEAFRHAEHTH